MRTSHVIRGVALGLLCLPVPGHAEFDYAVGADLAYSDNPAHEEESQDPQGDLLRRAIVQLDYTRESRKLDADISLRQAFEDYRDNVLDDRSPTTIDGALDWHVVPERFTWVVRERYGQISQNTFAVTTPDNEQDTNAIVTGPDFTVPLDSRDYLQLGARVGDYWFEETNEDNSRAAVQLGLERRFSPVLRAGIGGRYEQVDYDTETATQEDFTRQSVFFRVERQINDGELSLAVGHEQIERDRLDDVSAPLVILTAQRDVGGRGTAGLQLRSGTIDLGQALSRPDVSPLDVTAGQDNAVTGDVGTEKAVHGYYRGVWSTLKYGVDLRAADENYAESNADREVYGLATRLEYALARGRSLFLELSHRREDYGELDRTDDRSRLATGLQMRIGRSVGARLAFSREEQNSDDAAQEYEENRIMLSVRYGSEPFEYGGGPFD